MRGYFFSPTCFATMSRMKSDGTGAGATAFPVFELLIAFLTVAAEVRRLHLKRNWPLGRIQTIDEPRRVRIICLHQPMTTANKVTIARILLIPFFVVEVLYYMKTGIETHRLLATVAFGIAAG